MIKQQFDDTLLEDRLKVLAREVGLKEVILTALNLAIKEDSTLRSDQVETLLKLYRKLEEI
ncbi:hypothetical protein [Staphylococcus aureus]|uniref:hypothetical protein n=1 Tax=Staphylococcus aureus TaxID=1280 RepID=UPI0013036841|nr:hypothetical protein [Staphylococcus aureus]